MRSTPLLDQRPRCRRAARVAGPFGTARHELRLERRHRKWHAQAAKTAPIGEWGLDRREEIFRLASRTVSRPARRESPPCHDGIGRKTSLHYTHVMATYV